MSAASLLLFCMAGAAPPAPDVERAADAVIAGLALDRVPGLDPELDIGVSTSGLAEAAWPERLGGALLGALAAKGWRAFALPAQASVEEATLAGAEWRLVAAVSKRDRQLVLDAALYEIDRGAFAPSTDPTVVRARATITLDAATPPPAPGPARLAGAFTLGARADTLAVLDGPILALAACGDGLEPGELLFVLTEDEVFAYATKEGRLSRVASGAVELPPAAEPTREPVGRLICAPPREDGVVLAAGHGRGAGAALLQYLPKRGFHRLGRLPNLPVAAPAPGRWILGRLDHGRARFAPELGGDPTPAKALAAPRPFYELWPRPDGYWLLDDRYELFELDARLTPGPRRAVSGPGGTARVIDGAEVVVLTSARRDGERVALLATPSTGLPLEGPVQASAILRLAVDRYVLMIATARADGRSALLEAPLQRGPAP